MNGGDTMHLGYNIARSGFALDVELDIPLHGITGIFGASGAGKTTLLRCIAGLEQAEGANLIVAGDRWQGGGASRPVHEREIGYVFQEPRLFSHLNVRANIEYGMRRSGSDKGPDLTEVVDLLGLSAFLERRPQELSGGEAQRVAIARALLRAPKFVLMDEPLASLDAAHKDEILPFLDRLHTESSIPIIYVSHNIEEICRLCDHLVVIDAGQVVSSGELQSVLVNMDISQLAGEDAGSVIVGSVVDYDEEYDLTLMSFKGGELWLPGRLGDVSNTLRLRVRANDISITRKLPTETTVLNLLDVVIENIQDTTGPTLLLRLAAGREQLMARITRRSCKELKLQPGDSVVAQVKAVAVRGPKTGE